MSIERSFLRYRNRLEKIFGKKYRTGNGKNKNSLKGNKVLLEPLEPRILLSADLKLMTAGGTNDYGLPLQRIDGGDIVKIGDPFEISLVQDRTGAEVLTAASAGEIPRAGQIFFLNFDGANDVTYEGPVTVRDIDIPAFDAPAFLETQKAEIIASVLDSLQETFADLGVTFISDEPLTIGNYSTIYIGGNGEAFAEYGRFIGLSEKIDSGNADPSDIAFIFSENLPAADIGAADYAAALSGYIAHEAGHLLGFEHAHTVNAAVDSLADVSWKPYTHIEIATDVRNDLLADENGDGQSDGDLTIGIKRTRALIEKYA